MENDQTSSNCSLAQTAWMPKTPLETSRSGKYHRRRLQRLDRRRRRRRRRRDAPFARALGDPYHTEESHCPSGRSQGDRYGYPHGDPDTTILGDAANFDAFVFVRLTQRRDDEAALRRVRLSRRARVLRGGRCETMSTM